jgi:phytoene dehydrogenase-like protein
MVYEDRPKACREYPHTNRKRMYQILNLTHKNCEVCPVVYCITDESHNRDDVISGLYLVGAGTHPGAGIPGVVASAKATAGLMLQDLSR